MISPADKFKGWDGVAEKNKKGRAGWTGRGGTLSGETRAGRKIILHVRRKDASAYCPEFHRIDPAAQHDIFASGSKFSDLSEE
jgi:hypothetical protein